VRYILYAFVENFHPLNAGGHDDCKLYGSRDERPISFESAFNLNRTYAPEEMADGVCNPTPTCSKRENEYDFDDTEGPYLLKGATCSGGECSKPLEDEPTDCGYYNGRTQRSGDTRPIQEIQLESLDYYCTQSTASAKNLLSRSYTCTETGGLPSCTKEDPPKDLDTDKRLCDACLKATGTAKITAPGTATTYSSGKCCGDDAGEGGFPYAAAGISAKRTSGLSGGGNYGIEVCDDYYGTSKSNIIDNDCDGKKDCADSDCTGANYRDIRNSFDSWKRYLNPAGALCCDSDADCNNFLDPQRSEGGRTDCTGNTCDCKAVGTATPKELTLTPGTPLVVKTCVPRSEEIFIEPYMGDDRAFHVSGAVGRTFRIVAQDIEGGVEDCGGIKVKLICAGEEITPVDTEAAGVPCDSEGFFFKSNADVDCLVTVTII
jgi:hypothetical protein